MQTLSRHTAKNQYQYKYSQKRNCAATVRISTFHVSVSDLYTPRIDLPILLQELVWTDPGSISIAHRHMNVEIGTDAAQFPEIEYINEIFVAVQGTVIPKRF
jgi:hypothetical protein